MVNDLLSNLSFCFSGFDDDVAYRPSNGADADKGKKGCLNYVTNISDNCRL